MLNTVHDWSETIKNLLEGVAILGAAAWAIFRFGIFRERFAKIEFNLDCRYIGMTEEHHIVELVAVIENKGMVRQHINEWTFDMLLLKEHDEIDETESRINYQVKFPIKKISKRPWVPTSWYLTFVDAGTKQIYSYLTSVPSNTMFITIYSRFIYPKTNDFHSSQRTFNVSYLAQNITSKSGA